MILIHPLQEISRAYPPIDAGQRRDAHINRYQWQSSIAIIGMTAALWPRLAGHTIPK